MKIKQNFYIFKTCTLTNLQIKSPFVMLTTIQNSVKCLLLLSAVDSGTDQGELLNSEYVPCWVGCGTVLVARGSNSGPGFGLKRDYSDGHIF